MQFKVQGLEMGTETCRLLSRAEVSEKQGSFILSLMFVDITRKVDTRIFYSVYLVW